MSENVIEEAAKALEAAERLLALGEPVPEEDPDIGAKVREIGVGFGFGAMMSSAQASWRKHLIAHGDPPGGEYAVVGCHAMVVEELARVRSALASLRKAAEGAEVLYRHRVTGNVYSALDVGNVDHPFVKDAFSHVLVLPIPEPGKEPR